MEPERPIEKLLRKTAKARASPPAVDLRSATRRMLQGEVARQFGQATAKTPPESFSDRLLRWWPRMAWSFGVILGLIAAAALMIPRDRSAPQMSLAQYEPRVESSGRDKPAGYGLSGSVSDGKNKQELPASTSADVMTASRAPMPSAPTAATTSESSSLAKAAHEERSSSAVVAPGSGGGRAGGELASRQLKQSQQPVPPAPVSVPAGSPQIATDQLAGTATVSGTTHWFAFNGARFSQQLKDNDESVGTKDASPPPVLASFTLQEENDRLQVVDSDGSVYVGNFEPNAMPSGAVANFETRAQMKNLGLAGTNRRREAAVSAPNQTASADANRYFRVVGTNRSLNAKVEFAGTITTPTNAVLFGDDRAAANGPTNLTAGGAVGSSQSLNLRKAQISGQAVIGDKQVLDVKATATKP